MANKKKMAIIICSVLLVLLLGIILVSVVSNKSGGSIFKTQFGDTNENIKLEETHYIDKSLINVPIEIPYEVSSELNASEMSWISSNNEILVVNEDNTVTALTEGTATLTLISNNNPDINATINIIIE